MHISEQVEAELIAQGFEKIQNWFQKPMPTGGAFGTMHVRVMFDRSGRWLERFDGWAITEKEVDLRDYLDNPKAAIAAVLT